MGKRFHEQRFAEFYRKTGTPKYHHGPIPGWLRKMWHRRSRAMARREDFRCDLDTHLPIPAKYAGSHWEWF